MPFEVIVLITVFVVFVGLLFVLLIYSLFFDKPHKHEEKVRRREMEEKIKIIQLKLERRRISLLERAIKEGRTDIAAQLAKKKEE